MYLIRKEFGFQNRFTDLKKRKQHYSDTSKEFSFTLHSNPNISLKYQKYLSGNCIHIYQNNLNIL